MRAVMILSALLLVACGDAPQSEPAEQAPASPAAAFSLADVAGTWHVRTMLENSDSVVAQYDLYATDSAAGWGFKFVGTADTIPVQSVSLRGDTVVTAAGPFPSAVRPGVMVRTEGLSWLENGRMIGRTIARYSTTGADSVVTFRTEGTRAP